jgi:PEP-CTERM motif
VACAALWLLSLGPMATPSAAGPLVGYQINLTIDSVMCDWSCGDPLANGARFFGALSAGQTFSGGFAVDANILATDGIVNTAPIHNFRMPFGNALYSTGQDNKTLWGFRNEYGLGAIAPGFKVQNGEVVDFVGDFYGSIDFPYVDFYSEYLPAANRFWAYDGVVGATGTVTITRIPEPATLALLALGLAAIGFSYRRKTALQRRT